MVYLWYIYGIFVVILSGYDLLMLSSSTGTHRIHGAGIYANIGGYIDGIHVTMNSSTMDPMGWE